MILYLPRSLFDYQYDYSEERVDLDGEFLFFFFKFNIVSIYGDLCDPSKRRADSPREINEAERSDWIREQRIV